MHRFKRWADKWWQKPLVDFHGRPLPAELAVLFMELSAAEKGVWINSRGFQTGASDLVSSSKSHKTYETVRISIPNFVVQTISDVMTESGLARGCPDLVIWNNHSTSVRFVEVKCPHWDAPTPEQDTFLSLVRYKGLQGKVVNWEFLE